MVNKEAVLTINAKVEAAAESIRQGVNANQAIVICVNEGGLVTIGSSLMIPSGLGSPETASLLTIAILKSAAESLEKRKSDVRVEKVEIEQDADKVSGIN